MSEISRMMFMRPKRKPACSCSVNRFTVVVISCPKCSRFLLARIWMSICAASFLLISPSAAATSRQPPTMACIRSRFSSFLTARLAPNNFLPIPNMRDSSLRVDFPDAPREKGIEEICHSVLLKELGSSRSPVGAGRSLR
ncbi:hypothetical protein D3C80_1732580 [compost metagenome]